MQLAVSDFVISTASESGRYRTSVIQAIRGCVPSLPLLVGLIALLRVFAEPRAVLNDPDTYLHIAAGRWIWAHGALPTADPFSFSMAGGHWAVPEWLAEMVLAGTYAIGGWGALIALTAASLAGALAVLTHYLSFAVLSHCRV